MLGIHFNGAIVTNIWLNYENNNSFLASEKR